MYKMFFGFEERPFATAPRTDRYFAGRSIEAARQTLARAVDRAEGVGLVIGPSGTGKSLVLELLAAQFRDQFAVVLLGQVGLTTRRALLQAILYDLGLPYRGLDEGELRLTLVDHLSNGLDRAGMLLLVDEAHALGLRLLEEIRLISNLVRGGQSRVRLVLAGNPVLEERFALPRLASFSQRLSARCYLEPLDADETQDYVRTQIASVGGNADWVFTSDALDRVFRASDGIGRLINQVCDHALVMAYADGRRCIDGAAIEAAWADLQQLPLPWTGAEEPAAEGRGIIEFGRLVDSAPHLATVGDDEELPEASMETTGAASTIDDEDEFRPAGTIGPEVELRFGGHLDPFAEPFAAEEVVFDRYASQDVGSFGRVPLVHSQEGRLLSALMGPFAAAPHSPLVLAETQDVPQGPGVSPMSEWTGDWGYAYTAETSSTLEPVAAGIGPVAAGIGPVTARYEAVAAETFRVLPEGPPSAQSEEADPQALDDLDQIIIEDDPVEPRYVPAPAARRQEYRHLFARLRRG